MPRLLKIAELAPTPGPGFDQPFEMLEACHERVNRSLDLLRRIREQVARAGVDAQVRQAAQDVMRYFDVAGPQHHLDEERHVLPALEAAADPELAALAARLRGDHRAMEQGWAAARGVLAALAEGSLASLDPGQAQSLEAFAGMYADHIRAEEAAAYPAAKTRLDPDRLAAMSADMMARRGVK